MMNGTSVIVEDIEMEFGIDIQWTFTDSPIPPVISKILLKNFPAGTTIKYTDPVDGAKTWVSGGVDFELQLPGNSTGEFRSVLNTLTIVSAPQSDDNFDVIIRVTTDPSIANRVKELQWDWNLSSYLVRYLDIQMRKHLDFGFLEWSMAM
jgi:hypothetical protein